MLQSSKKLSNKNVLDIIKNGRIAHTKFFILRWNKTTEQTRFAVIVSKKTIKTAAGRNNLKRPVYKIIQEIYPTVFSGFNIAVFAKDQANSVSYDELKSDILNSFLKNNFINPIVKLT